MKKSNLILALLFTSCIGKTIQFKLGEINEIALGGCSGSEFQKYSKGTPAYDSVLSWFSRNTEGWKTDIASRGCKEIIKYDAGTIMVSDSLVTINYKDSNKKFIQVIKMGSHSDLQEILSKIKSNNGNLNQ